MLPIFCYAQNTKVMTANSNDMSPEINKGDRIIYDNTDYKYVKIGDIIIYKSSFSKIYKASRVVLIDEKTFSIKDDSRQEPYKKSLSKSNYIGLVIAKLDSKTNQYKTYQ